VFIFDARVRNGQSTDQAAALQQDRNPCLQPARKRTIVATLIHRWRPWEKSTGPKTPEGKRRSAMRGYKGGHRKLARELSRALREQKKAVQDIDTV
ncbi:hypothetical protein N9H39_04350, partial [Gammaproteobacteria bacterium]|nr:hypothetical protein [Gammaproteobacteria bacterium]